MVRSIRLIQAIILLLLFPSAFLFVLSLFPVIASPAPWFFPFVCGLAVGIVLVYYIYRIARVVVVFEHELTHAVAALMFFRRINGFVVTSRDGGYVQHSHGFGGEIGDDFIGLAPYLLPIFSTLFICARPLIPGRYLFYFDLLIGVSYGYHLFSSFMEIKQNWTEHPFQLARTKRLVTTDIAMRGFLFSLIYIVVFSFLIHGILLAVLTYGYPGIRLWWINVIVDSGKTVYGLFMDLLGLIEIVIGEIRL